MARITRECGGHVAGPFTARYGTVMAVFTQFRGLTVIHIDALPAGVHMTAFTGVSSCRMARWFKGAAANTVMTATNGASGCSNTSMIECGINYSPNIITVTYMTFIRSRWMVCRFIPQVASRRTATGRNSGVIMIQGHGQPTKRGVAIITQIRSCRMARRFTPSTYVTPNTRPLHKVMVQRQNQRLPLWISMASLANIQCR